MRIAIDARMMGAEATRGIGRYIHELIGAMLQIAPEHRYILVTRAPSHAFSSHPSVETIVADIPWYGVAEQIRMPGILRATRADIIHVPHWNVPLRYRGPLVVTIHDLLLRHEQTSAKASTRNIAVRVLKQIGFRLSLDHAVAAARKILVPTRFTADDVALFYPQAQKKIVVTGEGMPDIRNFERQTSSVATSYKQQSTPYLLYVGSAYPHKGVHDVLTAWKGISQRYPEFYLKIAGEMDVFMQRMRTSVVREGLDHIEFLGRVSEDELQMLYREAFAFIYPTHFEGFGLPPLEAIAAGCPVICSDAGPLKEVLTSGGAIFFRAGDANAILHAVTEAMENPAALRRDLHDLVEKLAKRHDWKIAAAKTLAAYQETIADGTSWQATPKNG